MSKNTFSHDNMADYLVQDFSLFWKKKKSILIRNNLKESRWIGMSQSQPNPCSSGTQNLSNLCFTTFQKEF